jgi:hypothetical protein
VGYILCGSPGDVISAMGEAPLGALGYQMGFFGSGSSREFRVFLQRVTMVWVSNLHLLSHLSGFLGKRKVKYMRFQSTFPPFYRIYLIKEWHYN